MPAKLLKRLSSSRKNKSQAEILHELGLEADWIKPLELSSMLDISTWSLENQAPLLPKHLPRAFLQRLWLLSPESRSTRCMIPCDDERNSKAKEKVVNGPKEESVCAVNPLDLITVVYTCANSFLQQEITVRMAQCQFAVPLVLPAMNPKQPSCFLLWPLRSLVSQWQLHLDAKDQWFVEGDMASTEMPMVSCVKLGHCGISKSRVLNHLMTRSKSKSEVFTHRGMDGGHLHRRLSNGLVELGWCLPTGDHDKDVFPVPVVISNLRGDAAAHDKCLSFLCRASSAVVVFCGTLQERDKRFLASLKGKANKLILIDLSHPVDEDNDLKAVWFVSQNLEEEVGLPKGSVVDAGVISEVELADCIRETLNNLLPYELIHVTLEAAAKVAVEEGMSLDEGAKCNKAMATVEKVLRGLEEGSAQFKEKQLPLQGAPWAKLAELEKEESQQRRAREKIDPMLQKEKTNLLLGMSSYRMTAAMKVFTDSLYTSDIDERTYFLNMMKLRLRAMQAKQQYCPPKPPTNLQQSCDDLTQVVKDEKNERDNNDFDDDDDQDSFVRSSIAEKMKREMDLFEDQPLNMGETEEVSLQQLLFHEQDLENVTQLQTTVEKQVDFAFYDGAAESQTLKTDMSNSHVEQTGTGQEIISPLDEKQVDTDPLAEQIPELNIYPGNIDSGFHWAEFDEPKLTPDLSESKVPEKNCTDRCACIENRVCSVPFKKRNLKLDPSTIGLEHFLREMGLIFELTHISRVSGSHNVLRLPSLAADLLLYGIALEIMDGDASNIPISWLGCVLAELKRRLSSEEVRVRVLTNIGMHHAGNSELLCSLFGVNVPGVDGRFTKGIYLLTLCLPDNLRKEMDCDLLLMINVEGLCSPGLAKETTSLVHDNEMATVATGISDILIHNIASGEGNEFESNLNVVVNALLRTEVCGSTPICQLVIQDEELNSKLQALQLGRVTKIIQTPTDGAHPEKNEKVFTEITSNFPCIIGPWQNILLSESVHEGYSKAVLTVKTDLLGTLRTCAGNSKAAWLPEFMGRLCAVWEEVKAQSFSIGLQNSEVAEAFRMLCTELSLWERKTMEHMEIWFTKATKRIRSHKATALEIGVRDKILRVLKDDARQEVDIEVTKIRTQLESYVMKDDLHITYIEPYRPNLMEHLKGFQLQATEEMIERLESQKENLCSATQLRNFQTSLEEQTESKLHMLTEASKFSDSLLEDKRLEEEFANLWSTALSNFSFRPSETDDITARVSEILQENLISRGLQKHLNKLEGIEKRKDSAFVVHDEYFGYRSKMKYNNRQQRLEAHYISCKIIEEYDQFVIGKSSLFADFSDSYISELLENIEKNLRASPLEIRSAFEVDLKVFLCSFACQDFQEIHDRYAKDRELLTFINGSRNRRLGEFIYQFRKRDQCQRVARAFTSMVFKPTALDYIYRPLVRRITEEMTDQDATGQYSSPWAFNCSLLVELLAEESFESYLEYLLSYDTFGLMKIQERVVAHLSESTILNECRIQRLGEVIGKMAAAVSQTARGVSGALSDTKVSLEKVCLTLEKDGDVKVVRDAMDGPLFSISAEWNRFVSCLLDALGELRLALIQEFSQNVDVAQLLQTLPIKPQECLFERVRGCGKHCPFCRAPCDVAEVEHEVHRTLLHRPKGMLSYTCDDSSSLSHISCPADMGKDNQFLNKDTECKSMAYKDYRTLYPDWSISPEDLGGQTPVAYWRHVMVKFNEEFAEEYEQEPAHLPVEWRRITLEEALESLKETREEGLGGP